MKKVRRTTTPQIHGSSEAAGLRAGRPEDTPQVAPAATRYDESVSPDLESTTRFSDRVRDYVRWRPSYPDTLLDLLRDELGLEPHHVVADLGSGTGLLARLFVDNGNQVYGVEPNRAMAEAAEALFAGNPNFTSVDGTAEATGLPDRSVDLAVAGQAFHWFDPEPCALELRRILRPGGSLAVVWNLRRFDTPFLAAYEAFLHEWGTDYGAVSDRYEDPRALEIVFGEGGYERRVLDNEQVFDFEGLQGRVLSSSYMPAAGHARYEAMLDALRPLFDEHEEGGEVRFLYRTAVYFGSLLRDGWIPLSP
jgi:SAM-dependent methyltransferase